MAAVDEAELAEVRALLLAEREATQDRIAGLTRDVDSVIEAARFGSPDDEHDPEGATTAFERSQTSALIAFATQHLADIDAALARIADGSYGTCAGCGHVIPRERLLARPSARTCIACT